MGRTKKIIQEDSDPRHHGVNVTGSNEIKFNKISLSKVISWLPQPSPRGAVEIWDLEPNLE